MVKGFFKRYWRVILLCVASGILGVAYALINAEAFHATSEAEFCISCHAMEPMVAAYEEDLHGGKNRFGIRASCCDCHLPHDTVTHYVIKKHTTSLKDIWGNFVTGPENIDWLEKRDHRERFAYDSGCLRCHGNLEAATKSNMKSFLPHRDYFLGRADLKCVTCHKHVGHRNLGNHLQKEK